MYACNNIQLSTPLHTLHTKYPLHPKLYYLIYIQEKLTELTKLSPNKLISYNTRPPNYAIYVI